MSKVQKHGAMCSSQAYSSLDDRRGIAVAYAAHHRTETSAEERHHSPNPKENQMNVAKTLLRSALHAAGNPPLATKVTHDAEKNAQRVYTAMLDLSTMEKLNALSFNFTSISDLDPMLDKEEGVAVLLDKDNKKHAGSLVRITRSGFKVAVGSEWRHMSGCNLIGIPLGFGKLHIQFTRIDGRDGTYIKVS